MDMMTLTTTPAPIPTETPAPDITTAVTDLLEQPFSWTKLAYTILVFLACLVVMKVLMSMLDRTITRLKIERSLHTFLKSIFRILLWFLTVLIVWDYIGLPAGALLGVLGVAGLAVSLALQGTLSNLAGGIMILVSKPFVVGDYIEAGGVGGTVADIGLVYTRVKTVDNKLIFVPNGEISKDKIVNYTNQEKRRVDIKFSVSYDADPELVKKVIREVVGAHPKAMFTPEPFVRTASFNDSSVSYQLRVWCATEDYWDLYHDLLEQVRAAFGQNGIDLTYNHLNVHLLGPKDESNIKK